MCDHPSECEQTVNVRGIGRAPLPSAVQRPPPTLPARIGAYRVAELLGRGGMGMVYRAQHESSGEWVALKKVSAVNDTEIAGLRREIDALRRLDHPGVVRIADQGMVHGEPWYAMELLEGQTLSQYNRELWRSVSLSQTEVRTSPDPEPHPDAADRLRHDETRSHAATRPVGEAACGRLSFALSLVRQLCSTLSYVHGEGFVHRDIKSDNIALCGGRPKLLDFGLVRFFSGPSGREVLDAEAELTGTAGYMAPEQVRGEMVDARADLYSLGCVLYELVTGRLPFVGHDTGQVLRYQLETTPLPPSHWVTGVPEALDDLVMTLLQKVPERRCGHASEVADHLVALGAAPSDDFPTPRQRSYVYRSPLVGRDQAGRILAEHVEEALAGRGSLLAISGDSGIGKTYLAMSSAREAMGAGMRVIMGRCSPVGAAGKQANVALLHPFRALLLAVADRCLAVPELTPSLLGTRAKVLAACEPSLATLPAVAAMPDPEPLPAQATQKRLLDALADTLAALAEVCPLALLLDDVQWADELSLSFLTSRAPDWFQRKRLLIVTLHRADEETGAIREMLGRPYTRTLALPRLGDTSVHEIVRGMLAMEYPPEPLLCLLARQSAGNPFFVAEYLRTAVAEQLLYRDPRGGWRVDPRLLAPGAADRVLPLPRTIVSLVTRRLRGLSEGARRLLSAAAVLGSEMPGSLLRTVAELTEEQAWAPSRELIARQVLEEPGPGRLRFLHDKLRETAYRDTPATLRAQLHRKSAQAMKREFRGTVNLPLTYATLAHHCRRGGLTGEAISYLDLAGEHALSTYANHDAVAHFSEAVELDAARKQMREEQPASRARRTALVLEAQTVRRVRRERHLAEAHYAMGDLRRVDQHLGRALECSGRPAPATPLGWTVRLLRDAVGQVRRAGAESPPAPVRVSRRELYEETALVMHQLAERHYYSFDALPMIGASLRSVTLAERAGVTGRIAKPYAMLGMAAGVSGLSRVGEHYFEQAKAAAHSAEDDAGLAYALYAEAAWRIGEGAWDQVRTLSFEGVRVAERAADTKAVGMCNTLLGHVAFYTGDLGDSARIYQAIEDNARRTGDAQHLSWGLYAGARARMLLGEFDRARDMLLESNVLLENLVEVPSKIIAPGLLAVLWLRQGDMKQALAAADLTASRIRKNLPTVFATVAGYAGVAEVYLAHWEQQRATLGWRASWRAGARAGRALLDLSTLAANIPLSRPVLYRLLARWWHGVGSRALEWASLDHSLSAAESLDMPYEAALSRVELGRLSPLGSDERETQLNRAERALLDMGCSFDLERMSRIRVEDTT